MEKRGKEGEKKGLCLVQVVSGGTGTTLVLVSYQSDRGGTVLNLMEKVQPLHLRTPSLIGGGMVSGLGRSPANGRGTQLPALCPLLSFPGVSQETSRVARVSQNKPAK